MNISIIGILLYTYIVDNTDESQTNNVSFVKNIFSFSNLYGVLQCLVE